MDVVNVLSDFRRGALEWCPSEIVVNHILPYLGLDDVLHMAGSCRRFYKLINGTQQLWKNLFRERYPELLVIVERHSRESVNWKMNFQARFKIHKTVRQFIEIQSSTSYPIGEIEKCFTDVLCNRVQPVSQFLEDEVMQRDSVNLTVQYYKGKVARYLSEIREIRKWNSFIQDEEKSQDLFVGAQLFFTWFTMLESVDVRAKVIEPDMSHLLKAILEEARRQHIDTRIELHFTARYNRQMCACIVKVLFTELGFVAKRLSSSDTHDEEFNYQDYYEIQKIIQKRRGTPILVAVLLQELCKKLECNADIVSHDAGEELAYFFRYPSKYSKTTTKDQELYYFNIKTQTTSKSFENIHVVREPSTLELLEDLLKEVDALLLLSYQYDNIECFLPRSQLIRNHFQELRQHCLTIQWLIRPKAIDVASSFATLSVETGNHLDQAIQMLSAHLPTSVELFGDCNNKRLTDALEKANKLVFDRPNHLEFAVGTLIRYNYIPFGVGDVTAFNKGVVISWTIKFTSRILPRRASTFYNILTDDNRQICVTQEALTLEETPAPICNDQLGIFFTHFDGNFYIPNMVTDQMFPEDKAYQNVIKMKSYE